MAGGIDIHLDSDQANRLRKAADEAGVSPAEFVNDLIDSLYLSDRADDGFAEYDKTGETFSAREALAEFAAGVREDHSTPEK